MAKQGISPHVTPEQFAGMLNELWDLAAQRDVVCGDYFFLEALLAPEGKALDFWGPYVKEL
jgi:hypothetical protein